MSKCLIAVAGLLSLVGVSFAGKPIRIDDRMELFVDSHLIETMDNVSQKLHEPILTSDTTDGPTGHYSTVLLDGKTFLRYDRGGTRKTMKDNPETYRYWTSKDGRTWIAPKLGLFAPEYSKNPNIILVTNDPKTRSTITTNFTPFIDANPNCKPDEKFKAVGGSNETGGLYGFTSADGIHWKRMGSRPLIRNPKVPGRKDWRDSYAFDSQNVAFWYQPERQYVCYHRRWVSPHGYHRTVYRSTSKDFVNWTESKIMEPTFKGEELYTNTMSPYFRAPHILIGLPTEIFPKRKNSTHILFLTSRGGTTWDRTFREAFIRPGLSENNKWGDRVNYAALNIVPMSDTEMSIYVRDRRYKLRTDGFVSIHAGFKPGALITKPLMFKGDSLFVNYSTSAGGSMRVEIQTPDGKPIKGFEPSNGTRMIGDQIRRRVSWRGNPSLKPLEGKPVRLKFSMKDADLYSMQFQEEVSP